MSEDKFRKPASHTNSDGGAEDGCCTTNLVLSLEGDTFPLFSKKENFFDNCKKLGQAGLILRYSDYWAICDPGQASNLPLTESRLICGGCITEMGIAFQMSLPGFKVGGLNQSLGDGSSNLNRCPFCRSENGILLWDRPSYGEITEHDIESLRGLWRARSQLWWSLNSRAGGICDICCVMPIKRGGGYHRNDDLACEECCLRATGARGLAELRKDPDYFGKSELRRARNFRAGKWRFEKGCILKV